MVAWALFTLLLGQPGSYADVDYWLTELEAPDRDEWQEPEAVLEAMGLSEGMRVADIGAATGYFTRHFSRAVGARGTVYAVDVEPAMLRFIDERAEEERLENVRSVRASATSPELPHASVDIAFLCATITHVANRGAYYPRLAEILAPGGKLVIIDFEKRHGIPVGPPFHARLAKEVLLREAEAAGFRLVEDLAFLPYQYFLVFETSRAE